MIAMRLRVDAHGPIPIRRQLTDPLTHVIDDGGGPRDPARPYIREFTGFVGTNPSTVGRVTEDLERSGHRPAPPPGNRRAVVHIGVHTATGCCGGDEGESFGGSQGRRAQGPPPEVGEGEAQDHCGEDRRVITEGVLGEGSGASSRAKPVQSMVLVIDRCTSRHMRSEGLLPTKWRL